MKLSGILIICFVLLFICINPVFALTGTEGVSSTILDLGLGARPLGMGGAFCALADDGNAGYWNPAGLGNNSHVYLTSMYTTLFAGTKFYYLSISLPLVIQLNTSGSNSDKASKLDLNPRFGSVSLLWVESLISGLQNTEDVVDPATGLPYTQYDDFSARDDALLFSYGLAPFSWLTFGMSGKLILRKIEVNDAHAKGWGMDTGIIITPIPDVHAGFLIQDIGNTIMKWSYTSDTGEAKTSREKSLSRIKVGLSWDLAPILSKSTNSVNTEDADDLGDLLTGLIISLEMRYLANGQGVATWHGGVEWGIYDSVFLRLGWDHLNFTAGVGLRSNIIQADYAYVTHPDLENTHRISLSARF